MTDETKQTQIELEESDLTSKSLNKFGNSAGIGVLASVVFGFVTLFSIGPSWLGLALIGIAAIAFWICADTGLDKLSSANGDVGDEWQKSVALKARSDAFIVCSFFVVIAMIILIALDILIAADFVRVNMDLDMDLDDLTNLFLALSGVMIFLPKLMITASIKPTDNPKQT